MKLTYPLHSTASIPPRTRRCSMFHVTFDNAKKRGRGKAVKRVECEGTLYTSGHVHLDTQDLPAPDFLSLGQLEEYLGSIGQYEISWIHE